MKKKIASLIIMTGLLIAHTPIETAQFMQRGKQATQSATRSSAQFLSDFFTQLGNAMNQGTQAVQRVLEKAKRNVRGTVVLAAVIAGIAIAVQRYMQAQKEVKVPSLEQVSQQHAEQWRQEKAEFQREFREHQINNVFERYQIPFKERRRANAFIISDDFKTAYETNRETYNELLKKHGDNFKQALAQARSIYHNKQVNPEDLPK